MHHLKEQKKLKKIKNEIKKLKKKKEKNQPTKIKTSGSTFKNPFIKQIKKFGNL